jgi:hypothetical protein
MIHCTVHKSKGSGNMAQDRKYEICFNSTKYIRAFVLLLTFESVYVLNERSSLELYTKPQVILRWIKANKHQINLHSRPF